MSTMLEKKLCQAAALTFEELGFVCPTLSLDESQTAAPLEAAVSVSFAGPFSGRLELKLYGRLLPILAANMLGENDGVASEFEQHDALREIANVVCGNFLPAMAGSRVVFDIQIPELMSTLEGSSGGLGESPEARIRMGLEEGRADLSFFAYGRP